MNILRRKEENIMKKRGVSIALVLTLVLGLCSGMTSSKIAYAATESENRQLVIDYLGLMETDDPVSSNETDTVTRAQFAQILYTLYANGDSDVEDVSYSSYPDVKASYWASGYIYYVTKAGLMSGYLSGYFKPESSVTMVEAAKACLMLLGYTSSELPATSNGIMSLTKKLGLYENIKLAARDNLTETACLNLLYNLLKSTTTTDKLYGEAFGCELDDNDEIDYETLSAETEESAELEGPIIVTGSWEDEIPFYLENTAVYKNGELSSLDAVMEYDVLYYNIELESIFVINAKVSGIIESIEPDVVNPSSVILGGKTYTLATDDVIDKVSMDGTVAEGDAVTLILDSDGTVLDILTETEYKIEYFGIISGISQSGTTTYISIEDIYGNTNVVNYSGQSTDYSTGDTVVITYSSNILNIHIIGYVSVLSSQYKKMVGEINSDATALGKYAFAEDIIIADAAGGSLLLIDPQRIADTTISAGDVLYYKLNEAGEISELVLNNVTNDLAIYAIAVHCKLGYANMSLNYTYTYNLNGKEITTDKYDDDILDSSNFDLGTGVVGIVYNGSEITDACTLTKIERVTSVTSEYVYYRAPGGVTGFKLSDQVKVCYYDGTGYSFISFDELSQLDLSDYTVSAYYDEPMKDGGRIRMIVIQ